MGYETRMYVGKSGHSNPEFEHETQAVLDVDYAYFPLKKDANDKPIPTGRTEIYFDVYAMVDMRKVGGSNLLKLDWINKESGTVVWYHYGEEGGNNPTKEDRYGDYPKPLKICDVIDALEKDAAEDEYRRFNWALALLKDMPEDTEVLLYGY